MKFAGRTLLRLALAALLMLAQHVALAHQAAHALDAQPAQSALCEFHGDIASLLTPAEGALPAIVPSAARFEAPAAPAFRRTAASPVAPASRGPPAPFPV